MPAGTGFDYGTKLVEIDIVQGWSVLWQKRYLIAGWVIICLIGAAFLSFMVLPPVYEVKTTLLVIHGNETENAADADLNSLESLLAGVLKLPELTIKTYVEQIKNPLLLKEVNTRLGLTEQGYTVRKLSRLIEVTAVKETNLIEIRVENTDPRLALSIANTLTRLLFQSISENTQKRMERSLSFLAGKIDEVEQELTELRKRLAARGNDSGLQRKVAELEKTDNLLSEKMVQIQIGESVNYGETRLQQISLPTLLDEPVKPNKEFIIVLAGVAGLFGSATLVLAGSALDTKIRSRKDVEEKSGLPVLAIIPYYTCKAPRGGHKRTILQ